MTTIQTQEEDIETKGGKSRETHNSERVGSMTRGRTFVFVGVLLYLARYDIHERTSRRESLEGVGWGGAQGRSTDMRVERVEDGKRDAFSSFRGLSTWRSAGPRASMMMHSKTSFRTGSRWRIRNHAQSCLVLLEVKLEMEVR